MVWCPDVDGNIKPNFTHGDTVAFSGSTPHYDVISHRCDALVMQAWAPRTHTLEQDQSAKHYTLVPANHPHLQLQQIRLILDRINTPQDEYLPGIPRDTTTVRIRI